MYCENCRKEVDDSSKFCSYCGSSLYGTTSKPRKSVWIWFAVGIITILILLSGIHECDWCGKTYVGAGYSESSMFGSDSGEIMCKDCAMDYYGIPFYKNFKNN